MLTYHYPQKEKKYKKLDSPTIKKLEGSFSTTTTSNGLHIRMSLKDSKTDYFTRIPKFLSPHHSLFIYGIISILTPRLLVCSLLQRIAVEVPLVGTEWRLGQGTSRAGWCRMPWERDCRRHPRREKKKPLVKCSGSAADHSSTLGITCSYRNPNSMLSSGAFSGSRKQKTLKNSFHLCPASFNPKALYLQESKGNKTESVTRGDGQVLNAVIYTQVYKHTNEPAKQNRHKLPRLAAFCSS